jgi:transposase
VVDSSSLAGHRRHRRAKTDRLDGQQWLTLLLRHAAGARQGGRIVRVPRGEEADRRQLPRAFTTASRERTRGLKRLQGRRASHAW